MSLRGFIVGILATSALLRLPAAARGVEQEWEIETRTLAHAPDGSPDSRTNFGIGEWVELKVVPETTTNVEWIIKGNALVTNRFGNPTLLLVGWGKDDAEIQMSATVHDKPAAATAPKPADPSEDLARQLSAGLTKLRLFSNDPGKFDAACEELQKAMSPKWVNFEVIGAAGMEGFTNFLTDSDLWSPRFPDSRPWAVVRRTTAEAAGFRLAACLDVTADKSEIPAQFWTLLHACIANLQSLTEQFEDAGGEKASEEVFNFRGANQNSPEGRRAAVANALRSCLPDLRELLLVQIKIALPGVPIGKLSPRLREMGFNDQERDAVFGKEPSSKGTAEK